MPNSSQSIVKLSSLAIEPFTGVLGKEQAISIALFDAVGTVIYPQPSVSDVYLHLGRKHGSELSESEVKRRISLARRKYFHVGLDAGDRGNLPPLTSNESIERQLWKQLVLDVFIELKAADELFEELWAHFADPKHWRLYPDVSESWSMLRKHGFKIGLASNFDSRLIEVCNATQTLSGVDFVYCSSQVGFRKPCPNFYREINSDLQSRFKTKELQIVMVGDDLENDCVAPALAGWQSVWLNRGAAIDLPSEWNGVTCVSSAIQFADWAIGRFNESSF